MSTCTGLGGEDVSAGAGVLHFLALGQLVKVDGGIEILVVELFRVRSLGVLSAGLRAFPAAAARPFDDVSERVWARLGLAEAGVDGSAKIVAAVRRFRRRE
jgi:hypothetical protein